MENESGMAPVFDQAEGQSMGEMTAEAQGIETPGADQAPSEQSVDLGTVDIESLPAEIRDFARSLQGDYTRKTQTLAEQRKQVDALTQALDAAGITPEQLTQYLSQQQQSYAGAYQQSYQQAYQQPDIPSTGRDDLDLLIRSNPNLTRDPVVKEVLQAFPDAISDAETISLRAALINRVELLAAQAETAQARVQSEAQQLRQDPILGQYLQSEADVRRATEFQRQRGLPSLRDAAILMNFDRVREQEYTRGRTTQTQAVRQSVPRQQGSSAGGTNEEPPRELWTDPQAMLRWYQERGRL